MDRLHVIAALVLGCLLAAACEPLVTLEVQDVAVEPVAFDEQSLVYDADGGLMATLRFNNREPVTFDDLPPHLVAAVVAAEDRRFFRHPGIDPRAILRAWVANRQAGGIVQGGSTITQQLVKNRYFPDAENTLERKVMEARLAWQLEQEASKEEILTEYLNTIYLGAGAYGIEAAAQVYFGTTTAGLTLSQSALLAGLIRSPETTSPYRDPAAAAEERARVTAAMVETGAISSAQRDAIDRAPLRVQPPPEPPATRYPYMVEHVKRALTGDARFGFDEASRWQRLFGGGLRIHTTVDPRLQAVAERAATAFWNGPEDPEVAIAVVQPGTGRILATVGGRSFADSQFDLAVQGRRQPGSTFKVFALAAALQRGWRLDSTIESGPFSVDLGDEVWDVRSRDVGLITLREALVSSSNGAFARLGMQLGGGSIETMARAMGITSTVGSNPSIVLGGLQIGVSPLDMASAFATLANGGVHVPVSPIDRITDAAGEIVYEPQRRTSGATDPETAYLVTTAMAEVIESGTGQQARLPDRPAAGKTGTVQDNSDAWFVGFTPELSVAVWVGYPDEARPLLDIHGVAEVQGGTWPARIWHEFMTEALAEVPTSRFDPPRDLLRTVQIDPATGGIATPYCPTTVEVTGVPGELPTFTCPLHLSPWPETATATNPTPTPAPTEPAPAAVPQAPAIDAAPAPAPPPPPTPTPSPPATPTPSPTPTPTPTPTPEGPAAPASLGISD